MDFQHHLIISFELRKSQYSESFHRKTSEHFKDSYSISTTIHPKKYSTLLHQLKDNKHKDKIPNSVPTPSFDLVILSNYVHTETRRQIIFPGSDNETSLLGICCCYYY